ncbi:hypothetical protein BY996DRAFT_6485899 [Phakopsora pachyrhizi]|nr:hypothetical protein BY996DRAFT_6485899 [Phakopsora pachyrhizi]
MEESFKLSDVHHQWNLIVSYAIEKKTEDLNAEELAEKEFKNFGSIFKKLSEFRRRELIADFIKIFNGYFRLETAGVTILVPNLRVQPLIQFHEAAKPSTPRDMSGFEDWMDVSNGFFEATRAGSKKCPCVFKGTPTFSEGQKVWCNPTTKSYGFEHPIQEVPTDDFDSGIVSTGKHLDVLKKAGIPTPSKGWTNHNSVVSNQVGTSEHLARSQLQRAKAASTTQHAKRQKSNSSTLTEATQADLNTVAIGSSSDEDGCKDRRGDTAETEDNKYCPLAKITSRPSSRPTRRLPNPLQGVSTTTMAGVTPGVDDLEPWVPEDSKLESNGFTQDRRLAMGLLRFMELAAVSDQMELEMTEVIREMGGWLEHLELNVILPYEAWNGSKGKGRAEGDPEE